MRPQIVTVGAVATSATLPVDHKVANFQIGIGCVINGGGTLTYKVQHTFDNIFDPNVTPTWFDHSTITGKTTNSDGNYAFPVRAIRLNVTAYTSGSVTMTLLQASGDS
jgi:hypothetical protein